MSANKKKVEKYIDGFNKLDHAQILSCLTDDIRWTMFGAYRVHGKEEYDANIEGPEYVGNPDLRIVRMVEENGVLMAELTVEIRRRDGGVMRGAMDEVLVMDRNALIKERRAYFIELKVTDYMQNTGHTPDMIPAASVSGSAPLRLIELPGLG